MPAIETGNTTARKVHTELLRVEREPYTGTDILRDALSTADPEVHALLKKEKSRQCHGLQLVASENFTSKAVLDALSSAVINKYSDGVPQHHRARYYSEKGCEIIDQIEILCQKRALRVFELDPEKWGVNVSALSGSPANFAVYTALVGPHGRIMGLEPSDGGHFSHGFFTPTKKVSATSLFFESLPYRANAVTGLIDYDQLETNAMLFRPKIIIAGTSSYARWLDYPRFRSIADKCGAYLMADIAHIAGLVAAGIGPSPFEYADVVTTTTHKSLRGPRGALIFYRKGVRSVTANGENILYNIGPEIDAAVHPGLQAGIHGHTISAIAVALKQCCTPEFTEYGRQVVKNAQALADALRQLGYHLVMEGTDTHLCLLDLRPHGLDASRVDTVLCACGIFCNKCQCPGDTLTAGGIRLGTPAFTSRGFKEDDFRRVAALIHRGIGIYVKHHLRAGATQKEFEQFIETDNHFLEESQKLAAEIDEWTSKFPVLGEKEY